MRLKLNILAPVDLARNGEAQVRYAVDIAEWVRGDVTLLYVTDPMRSPSAPVVWPPSAVTARSECHIQRVMRRGPAVETISQYARNTGTDLVVLTSRSFGRWARLWSRSAAAAIVASAQCPVWISKARTETRPESRIRRVLCVVALDGSDDARVQCADAIATRSGGELHLLHVMAPVPQASLMYSYAEIEWRRLSERSAAERLANLAESVRSPHTSSLSGGSPHSAIARAARDYGADLMVTNNPQPDDRRRATLDLRTLLSRLGCPVLAVPAEWSKAHAFTEGGLEHCQAGV